MSDCRASLSDANRHINTALQRGVGPLVRKTVSTAFIVRSMRAVCNFADEHLWFDSGLLGIGFGKLLRDNRRRIPFA